MLFALCATALAAPPTPLLGSWSFTGGKAQVEAAASTKEGIAQTFNFALRPIVRAKLNKPMHVDESIEIVATESSVEVRYQGTHARTVVFAPKGDGWLDVKGVVSLVPDGSAWVLDGANDEGGLRRRFVVSGSTLTLTSTLYSPQLEGEPSWTATYTRQ